MKQCALKDFNTVYQFFTRKDITGDITDDLAPDTFSMVKRMLSNDLVCMPSDGTLFVLSPVNSVVYTVHLNTTKPDKINLYLNTLEMARWVKNNTPIQRVVSYIPTISEATLHYSRKIGMVEVGRVPEGFLKNGKLVDNIIMSATVDKIIKELSKWQQQ